MQVKGVHIKVDTLGGGTASPAGTQGTDSNQAVQDYFDNAFGNGASSSSDAWNGNADPVDDYTFGDIKGGAIQNNADNASIWLASFPPTLEEIITGNRNAANSLDLVMQRYQKAQADLTTLRDSYQTALASASTTTEEKASLNTKIGLIGQALLKCDQEMKKVTKMASGQSKTYMEEMAGGPNGPVDLNNDGWIGRPGDPNSLGVVHKSDGTTVYIDPASKRAIPNPWTNPSYKPYLTKDGYLEVIDKKDSIKSSDEEYVDLYLRLTEDALKNFSADNIYKTPIGLNIPQSVWVERIDNGTTTSTGAAPIQYKLDSKDTNEEKMIPEKWITNGGLHQEVPSDLSKYVQVQVTDVNIISEDSGLKDNNDPPNILYNTIVEMKNNQTVIARLQIEGFYTKGSIPTAATTAGGNYVAASSVGIGIYGSGRVDPVKVDASQYKSTGRHVVEGDVWTKMGIKKPGDNGRGDAAHDENTGAFSADNSNYDYSSYHDVYVPISDKVDNGDPTNSDPKKQALLSNRTGIFVQGLRGEITGTTANDVIWTTDVNVLSDDVKRDMPADHKAIKKDDAFYSNIVEAGKGNNIVVAGKGDNFIFNATLAWVAGGSNDTNIITTPELYASGSDGKSTNAKGFVHVRGGKKNYIINPDETDTVRQQAVADAVTGDKGNKPDEARQAAAMKKYQESYRNDYYEVVEGAAYYEDPEDPDIAIAGDGSAGLILKDALQARDEAQTKWENELYKVPEADETQPVTDWDGLKSTTDLATEMNSFFNEMFGEADDLFNTGETSSASTTATITGQTQL
ncbi:MAG: hypothetical protein V2A66_10935 [Pseudomonadota bacterium]